MNDRDKSLLDDVTFWPRERRRTRGVPPNRIERRATCTLRTTRPPRRELPADLELTFSIEGGLAAGKNSGYNPYDNKPRTNDIVPWNSRRRR